MINICFTCFDIRKLKFNENGSQSISVVQKYFHGEIETFWVSRVFQWSEDHFVYIFGGKPR